MGLTVGIVSARFSLVAVGECLRRRTYLHTPPRRDPECFEANDHVRRILVSCIDCLALGRSLGRSVIMLPTMPSSPGLSPAVASPAVAAPLLRRSIRFRSTFPPFGSGPMERHSSSCLLLSANRDGRRLSINDAFFTPRGIWGLKRFYVRASGSCVSSLFPPESSRLVLTRDAPCGSPPAPRVAPRLPRLVKSVGQARRMLLTPRDRGPYPGVSTSQHRLTISSPAPRSESIRLSHGGRSTCPRIPRPPPRRSCRCTPARRILRGR